MSDWADYVFGAGSEQEDSSCGSSSASIITSSRSSQGVHSHQLGRQTTSRPSRFDTVRTSSATSSIAHVSSGLSTCSRGSELLSYLSSTPSVSGSAPSFSAASSASWSHVDPILEHLALNTPPASSAATPPRQTSRPSSSSSETTESDEIDSRSSEAEPGRLTPETPNTSDASPEEDNIFFPDQDPEAQVVVIPAHQALLGLVLQDEYPLLSDTNNGNNTGIYETLKDFQIEHANGQAKQEVIPWAPGGQDGWWPTSENSILAPPLGLGYNEYFSRTRVHRQRYERKIRKKAFLARRKARSTSLGSSWDSRVTGTPESPDDIYPHDDAQSSSVGTDSRSSCHDDTVAYCPEVSQPSHICRVLDCSKFSAETLISIFYPKFAFSHLTIPALETFSTELVAPESLISGTEYTIDLSLGFGPAIHHDVCAFIPRNKSDLQSYRKLQGEDTLEVQESLPIFLDIFSAELHAEEIDEWLDQVIDSASELQKYVELMQRKRRKGDLSVQILECIVSWYLASKNNLVESVCRTLRAALKLLMTTTLLTLVPKVKDIPESLSRDLSPQFPPLNLSPIAPKLLSRQIKASIHCLQRDLLYALLSYLEYDLKLAAEVKVAIALLIALVLELAQKAGREFAKFASKINSKVVVKQQDVAEYEKHMQTQVFGRLRTSIRDAVGELGQLGKRLRDMGLIVKGKDKDNGEKEYQYVAAILTDVL